MSKTDDPVALDQWYAVETATDVNAEPRRTRLLGQDILIRRAHPDPSADHHAPSVLVGFGDGDDVAAGRTKRGPQAAVAFLHW